jgi:hypothetical protein
MEAAFTAVRATTEWVDRAMLKFSKPGAPKHVLESKISTVFAGTDREMCSSFKPTN